jgi:hypothetical protein
VATRPQSDRWLRRSGFALGLAAVAVALLTARVPAAPHGLGLDLTVVATAPETVTLRPPGPLFTASGMRAGGKAARGSVTVVNAGDQGERIRLRALLASDDLDAALMIDASADGRRLYRGPLGGLRSAATTPLELGPGDGFVLRVDAWVPVGARGWRGHIEDLTLSFQTEPEPAP